MAQLVVSAAAATVGFMIGGPTGAQIGWTLGNIAYSAANPQKINGPRLDDLKVTGTEYGAVIPWLAGSPRISSGIWWSSDKREIATTTQAGKGGGPEVTNFTYEIDVLFGLGEREITYISRIWSNGKLVWTALADADADSLQASASTDLWRRLTVYTGAADQLPDPTYEAAVGATDAPGYRGRACVLIEGMQLGTSGQLPNLTFEVVCAGTTASPLGEGLLAQFDAINEAGTGLASELGPDFTLGANTLDVGTKKWGAGSVRQTDTYVGLAASATMDMTDRPWRVEGWAYRRNHGDMFYMSSTTGGYQITLTSSSSGWTHNITREGLTGGGTLGTADDIPAPNTWFHWAIQQTDAGALALFVGGQFVADLLGSSSVNAFTGQRLWSIRLGASGGDWSFDSTIFQPLDGTDAPALYDATGYSIPSGPFEPWYANVTTVDPSTETLQSVVEALCARSGMPDGTYDATELASITRPVRALAVSQVGATRAVLEQLMTSHAFTACVDEVLRFVPRGGDVVATIPYEDLGAAEGEASDQPLEIEIASDLELPAQVAVQYRNTLDDQQTGTEYSDRLISGQASLQTLQLAMGLTPTEAKGTADRIVADNLAGLTTSAISVPLTYAHVQASDVIEVVADDATVYRFRAVKRTDEVGVLRFDVVLDDPAAIVSAEVTDTGYTGSSVVNALASTVWEFLDIPLLRDADDSPGYYVAARGSNTNWPGGIVQASANDVDYSTVAEVAESAVMGETTTALGDWTGPFVVDERNTVTVTVAHGELSSATRDAILLDGTLNAILVGDEVIQYITATPVSTSPNVYTLSRLLRGRRGTEWAMTGHAAGERVVLLRTQGLRRVAVQAAEVGALRYLRGVTNGRLASSADAEQHTPAGVSSKPFAPVDLRAARAVDGSFSISWLRRSRLATTFTGPAGSVVPLGETSEAYQVDVMSGSTVLRTMAVTAAELDYTAAMQVDDFGAVQSTVTFRVYQMGALGRGYAAEATLGAGYTPTAQETTITLSGTFTTGLPIYVFLGATQIAAHTVVGGDTDLAGVATALAAAIDGESGLSAAAVGAAITVTGPVGVVYVLSVIVGGASSIGFNLQQSAAVASAGTAYRADVSVTNAITGITEPIPAGYTFQLHVERPATVPVASVSYTTTGSETRQQVLTGLANAVAASSTLASLGYTFSALSSSYGWYGRATGPIGATDVFLRTSGTTPFGLAVSVQDAGSAPVTADRPQIINIAVAGTVTTGERFVVLLAGVEFDYTAGVGDDADDVAAGLQAAIDADAQYTAVTGPGFGWMTATSVTAAAPFSYTGSVERAIVATVT